MAGFGPFDSFSEALIAACPLILSKPNATVGHIKDAQLASRVANEYCGWVYYTPERKYEMSMLTDQSDPGDVVTGRRTCRLSAFVDDPRYSPGSLKYILALHNHPFGTPLSREDMRSIIALANHHEWVVDTAEGKVPLAIVAFYSRSTDPASPTCDGFYQYTPETRELHEWIRTQDTWHPKKLGTVTWLDELRYRLDAE
ncbi:MAG: hypothetical protein JXB05_10535 [Myxococcaceae bacterium]|nr:hypothetical protein [Myxococcaceae bacterium]